MTTKKSRPAKPVRLGIIGTGGMANVHASQFTKIRGCEVVAACDVDRERAQAFAEKHQIPAVYGDAAALLSQEGLDAVSIVTPDAFHLPVALQCLAAGKHVLCEKPLALNAVDAKKMVTAAKKAGVINMVNFSYRDWSCIQAASASIRRGDIGEIRHVEASYLQAWLASKVWGDWRTSPAWLWRLSSKHGSKGALGDVGVHIVDFATFPAGPLREVFCRLKAFAKAPGNRIGEYRLDANDSATLNVEFANGALGVIHTSRWVGGNANRLYLKIAGTQGTIEIDSEVAVDAYKVCRGKDLDGGVWKSVKCKPVPTNYQRFIAAIQTGIAGEPDFARGLEVQKVLDACFVSDASNRPVRL
ncbi:MAG: Gfo/Idh/MocA family oxidoreductase [Terrimicrobiaceae bacterium]